MKNFLSLSALVIFSLFVTSVAFAGGAPKGNFKTGVITKIDKDTKVLSFQEAGVDGETTLRINDSLDLENIGENERVILSLGKKDSSDADLVQSVTKMFIDLVWDKVLFILFIGFVGGLVSGFIGSGGAFVLTPGMMSLGVPAIVAVASNMCHKFPKALIGAYKRYQYGQVDLKLGIIMGFCAIGGVLIGIRIQGFIFQTWGDAGSNLFVSLAFVFILVTVGGYVFRDAVKMSKGKKAEGVPPLAKSLRGINLPPMISLKDGGEISLWLILPVGFCTGLMAAVIAVGGFVGVPGMMYIIGVPGLVASATELVIAFVMGTSGSINWALMGMIDIRLTLLILFASLFGVQLGALGTTYVKDYMISYVMGTIMLIVAVSRGLAVPIYLTDLGLIGLEKDLTHLLGQISFAIMSIALLTGAFIILKAMLDGMKASKASQTR